MVSSSPDRLVPSPGSLIRGGEEVDHRFIELCGLYLRTRGVQLLIPPDMARDVTRWRQMRIRHRSRDFRHTDAEVKSLKNVANWTLRVKAELCGQPIPKVEL